MSRPKRTILIVDGLQERRAIWQEWLKEDRAFAWSFVEADNGATARELYQRRRPDCVLLAEALPDGDGLKVLSALRRAAGEVTLPVIILGSTEEESIVAKAFRKGAQEYLNRHNLNAQALRRTVRNVIERLTLLEQLDHHRRELAAKNQALEAGLRALRASEQQLRVITDSVPGLISYVDREQRYRFVNATYQRWFGLARDQMTGHFMHEVTGAVYDQARPYIERALAGEQVTFESTFDYPAGRKTVLASYLPDLSPTGETLGFYVMVTDITDRKQSEVALRASEELFHTMADTAPTIIWTAAPDGTITFHNQQWLDYTGISPLQNARDWPRLIVHPDDLERCLAQWTRALEQGTEYEIEVRNRRRDGAWRWFLTRATPVRDQSGRITAWFGSTTDIHDRKQVEEALRESAERLRLIARAAHIGTYDWHIADDYSLWGGRHAELFGLPPDKTQVTFEEFISFVHPEDRNLVREAARSSVEDGCEYQVEFRIIRPDGEERWMHDQGQTYRDATGRAVRMLGIVQDITERRRFEQERERLLERERAAREVSEAATRARDEFIAVVSHELRGPLNALLGWSKILRTENPDQATQRHAIEVIERAARQQQRLIEDLLDTERITSGKLRLETGPVDLNAVINAAVDVIRPAAEARNLALELKLEDDNNVISGDADRLQQVLWNLLSNAVKFTPPGGRVSVRLERVDPHMQITVSDTGQGIDPKFLPFVFDRFRQAEQSGRRRQGLGLGLALVKYLVELHGGTISADSNGAGQGASFIIALPLRAVRPEPSGEAEPQSEEAWPKTEPERNLDGLRVLVVDDEPEARDMIALLLGRYGASVSTAASAAEALAQIREEHPDVLVSDIGMPDEDGYDLIRAVRALAPDQGGQLPAIALTAFGRAADRIKALSAGFQAHIPKPVEPAELAMTIASLTERAGRSMNA